MSQWREHLGAGGLTAAEVAMQATMPGREELLTALLEVAASKRDPEKVDSLRLGHWLKRHKGRVASGLRLEKAGDDLHSKAVFWRVVSLNTTTRKNPVSNSAGIAGIAGIDSSNAREKSITIESLGESLKCESRLEQYPLTPVIPVNPASPATGKAASPAQPQATEPPALSPVARTIVDTLRSCPGGMARADLERVVLTGRQTAGPALVRATIDRLLLAGEIVPTAGRIALGAGHSSEVRQ